MDAERRNRLTALLASDTRNPLTPVVTELLGELDGYRDAASVGQELDELRKVHSDLLTRHQTVTALNESLQQENGALQVRAVQAVSDASTAISHLAGLQQQVADLRAIVDPLRGTERDLNAELARTRAELSAAQSKIGELTASLHDVSQRLADHEPPRRDRKVHE